MQIITQRANQLIEILTAWNSLDTSTQEKSINYISDFLVSASVVNKLIDNSDLKAQLERFKENYLQIFGFDVSKTYNTDLDRENILVLNEIKKIDERSDDIDNKRIEVLTLLSSKGFSGFKSFRDVLIKQSDKKYQHAHIVASYNYGNFLDKIESESLADVKNKVLIIKDRVKNAENPEEYFEGLVSLLNSVNIPDNFHLLSSYRIDAILEHTLINQGTHYQAKLDQALKISEIERLTGDSLSSKAKNFFTDKSQVKSEKIDDKKFLDEITSDSEIFELPEGLILSYGYEIEGIILPKGGPQKERDRFKSMSDFLKLSESLADNDSRKQMRRNYGFLDDNIGASPNLLLLFSEEELNFEKSKNISQLGAIEEKFNKIRQFFIEKKSTYSDGKIKLMFDKAIENLPLLSTSELFLLELFYIEKNQAIEHKIGMDDVFDWRDGDDQPNFLKIVSDIAYRGSFFKKTLDMIRASEFSIGEFEENWSQALSQAMNYFRLKISEYGLRFKDRGSQINIGLSDVEKSLIKISDKTDEDGLKLYTNKYTVALGKAIQNALSSLLEKYPFLRRDGQTSRGITVTADRKKGLIDKTRGTPYFIDANDRDKEFKSPFSFHRKNTGKSFNIRLSRIGEGDKAVFEIRLVGNNPHIPYYDTYGREITNFAEIFPKLFENHLKIELEKVSIKDIDKEGLVNIDHNGTIDGIETIFLKPCPEVALRKADLPYKPVVKEDAVSTQLS